MPEEFVEAVVIRVPVVKCQVKVTEAPAMGRPEDVLTHNAVALTVACWCGLPFGTQAVRAAKLCDVPPDEPARPVAGVVFTVAVPQPAMVPTSASMDRDRSIRPIAPSSMVWLIP
jgi:hypothetical protein